MLEAFLDQLKSIGRTGEIVLQFPGATAFGYSPSPLKNVAVPSVDRCSSEAARSPLRGPASQNASLGQRVSASIRGGRS
jgi:hypothetical protein